MILCRFLPMLSFFQDKLVIVLGGRQASISVPNSQPPPLLHFSELSLSLTLAMANVDEAKQGLNILNPKNDHDDHKTSSNDDNTESDENDTVEAENDDDDDDGDEEEEEDEDEEPPRPQKPQSQADQLRLEKAKLESLVRRMSTGKVPLRVHDVIIKGNSKTKDYIIEAEVEGIKNASTIQEVLEAAGIANAKLKELEIFDSVRITLDSGPPELPGTSNVIVEVVETKSPLSGECGAYTKPAVRFNLLWFSMCLLDSFRFYLVFLCLVAEKLG